MASDQEYAKFLAQVNQDPGQNTSKSTSAHTPLKVQDDGVHVPKAITSAIQEAVYTTDSDEPFVGVSLKWNENGNGLPDEVEFAKLIKHWMPTDAGIEIMDPTDWDPNGAYADLIDAVREAVKGADVRVYRVPRDATRTEYWLVGCDGKGADAKLVGAKALGIES